MSTPSGELEMDGTGVVIGEPLFEFHGVLTGTPTYVGSKGLAVRKSPVAAERPRPTPSPAGRRPRPGAAVDLPPMASPSPTCSAPSDIFCGVFATMADLCAGAGRWCWQHHPFRGGGAGARLGTARGHGQPAHVVGAAGDRAVQAGPRIAPAGGHHAAPRQRQRGGASGAHVHAASAGAFHAACAPAAQYQLRDFLQEREQLLESERFARGEAERAGRIKDEFLATLSHELRTPLNAVLGWTRVLRKSQTVPAEVANGLAVIERNARSQAQIIGDLLDMSSIISGKVRLDMRPLDLAAVLEATIETVRPAAEAKEIRVTVVPATSNGAMRGDPGRLQQVLWNLLANAVKFTPQGATASP